MAETRTSREAATREQTKRRWRPASALPEVKPEPGYGYRWIMTHLQGEAQPTNVSQRLREGYEPVRGQDHPDLAYETNAKTGNVEVGGLMLCKMPEEMLKDRAEFYMNQTNTQAAAASSKFLGQSDPRMPVFAESKSSSSRGSFGNGS